MTATMARDKVLSWASDIDQNTLDQAAKAARLPFVPGHVALMPDAHLGIGATVGSVIPTEGAIIPAAVGVDIGCGMIASETDLTSADLPDSLARLMPLITKRIPAGVGKGRETPVNDGSFERIGKPRTELTQRQKETAATQFGTLGSGNHFVEVALDERDHVWIVLHSGSRGIGNQLAQRAIAEAKGLMKERFIHLEDPDLAYLVQGDPQFDAYIADMLWAQDYAMGSRQAMMQRALRSLFEVVGRGKVESTINCHHNFTQMENHLGKNLWITRKGAIKAAQGDFGVIPGSMGTKSYIVSGNGVASSFNSCSHGAGRRMSRSKAKATFSVASLEKHMEGKTWNADHALGLLDEHPESYKDIDRVMADQADLVTVQHTLRQIFNYKGVK